MSGESLLSFWRSVVYTTEAQSEAGGAGVEFLHISMRLEFFSGASLIVSAIY
jgi:hypothetical protein